MRGRLLPFGVALMLIFGASGAAGQGLGILDIYRELQVAQPGIVPQDEVTAGPGGALSAGRPTVEVSADAARTYLRLREETSPGTAMETELAFWLDAEGLPLVGISARRLRSGAPVAGRILFYSRASGRWNPVTRQVWPRLEEPFCGIAPVKDEDAAQEDPKGDDAADDVAGSGFGPVVVLLPRTGVDAEAWCLAPSPRAGQGARVSWNPARAVFTLGPALAGAPPWGAVSARPGKL